MAKKKEAEKPQEPKKSPEKKETKLKASSEKAQELTPRQEFHKWYRETYLKDSADLVNNGKPHHADKHGILGYADNLLKKEIGYDSVKKEGIFEDVYGLCYNCTKSLPSASEEYDSKL